MLLLFFSPTLLHLCRHAYFFIFALDCLNKIRICMYDVIHDSLRPHRVHGRVHRVVHGWVDPWVGLGWVGSGWVEIFQFLVGWVGFGPL